MIVVSACLVGVNCKYNGGCNENPGVLQYLEGKTWVPVCPEQLGGLATPRVASEIQGGSGELVFSGQAKVETKIGQDVSAQFRKGAEEVLRIAQLTGANEAVLKERSPSCGRNQIYDGSFQGKTIAGMGVTAALLEQHGIKVKSEEDLQS